MNKWRSVFRFSTYFGTYIFSYLIHGAAKNKGPVGLNHSFSLNDTWKRLAGNVRGKCSAWLTVSDAARLCCLDKAFGWRSWVLFSMQEMDSIGCAKTGIPTEGLLHPPHLQTNTTTTTSAPPCVGYSDLSCCCVRRQTFPLFIPFCIHPLCTEE